LTTLGLMHRSWPPARSSAAHGLLRQAPRLGPFVNWLNNAHPDRLLAPGQPYALRDFDGRSMSLAEAKRIVAERYTVSSQRDALGYHWAKGRRPPEQ
jgi:hypothetical protein